MPLRPEGRGDGWDDPTNYMSKAESINPSEVAECLLKGSTLVLFVKAASSQRYANPDLAARARERRRFNSLHKTS